MFVTGKTSHLMLREREMSSSGHLIILLLLLHLFCTGGFSDALASDERALRHGQYLVQISGCNNCHTAGYRLTNGRVPMNQWLAGSTLTWPGPLGNVSPTNLRDYVSRRTESQWIAEARRMQRRPPMPWYDVNAMSDIDLRAIYWFIKSLDQPDKDPAAQSQNDEPQINLPLNIPLTKRGSSTYYLQVKIPGGSTKLFMIDTGAAYTTIGIDLLEELVKINAVTYQRPLTAIMADGSERDIKLYRVDKLTLGMRCNYHDVEVAVIPLNNRSILGMNLLKRSRFMIDAQSETLTIQCESLEPAVLLGPE